jgi:NAD(P)-dependent dehydrogenase (short-subunit alcohol dehydrogenase family)
MPTVLITGANRGLGLGLARSFAADGWRVRACCRTPAQAHELKALADEHPGRVSLHPLDVAEHDQVDALASELDGRPIDILINNAGTIGPRDPGHENLHKQFFGTLDYDAWLYVMRVNTLGPVKLAEALLGNLLAGEQKKIVNLSSTIGSLVEENIPVFAYSTSKTALNKAMRLLSVQLRDQGISVGIFCPGHVKTDLGGEGAVLEIDESVAGLRRIIDELDLERSGEYRRYNGELIAW